jgi:hypothetical protein
LALLVSKSKPVERPEVIRTVTPKAEPIKKSNAKVPVSRMNDIKKEDVRALSEKIAERPSKATPKPETANKKMTSDEERAIKRAAMRGTTVSSNYRGAGFRVQIYNGTNREEALRIKAEFMRNYPGIRTYFSYVSPHYRVKVGDFRRREDASGVFKEACSNYKPCMIVPDEIGIK